MAQVNLKQLVGKLNDTCRRSLEGAAGLCLSRTNYNVEIEHWFCKLLEVNNSDLDVLLQHFGVDMSRLNSDLTRAIDRLKTGNARPPALSPDIVNLVREAWLIGSIDFGEPLTRSGHLLCALLGDESLSRIAGEISEELRKIAPDALRRELPSLVASTVEAGQPITSATSATSTAGPSAQPKGPTKTPSLDQFTIDLTDRATRGQIDPVQGRDGEIRQIIDILTRRRQNNPILTGEAGVGKTAVVEGFALRIAAGDVPPSLQNVSIRVLDLGLLQAGAGVKGEFENRLKSVIDEVKASPTPIILFIDEAHTLIGAGGQAGQGDAANLLKPALARGELRTIAATTWAEYKKYFERDAALARRFQVVKVEEPGEQIAVDMMLGLLPTLEKHHRVRILNEALVDAVKLSSRYISGRQLPDKAVSLLDTTCARIGLSQTTTPPRLEDCRRRIERSIASYQVLQRETEAGADHEEALQELETARQAAEQELETLGQQWKREKELVGEILKKLQQLSGEPLLSEAAEAVAKQKASQAPSATPSASPSGPSGDSPATGRSSSSASQSEAASTATPQPADSTPPASPTSGGSALSPEQKQTLREELRALEKELGELQGEQALVYPCVNSQAVAETVSAWTGIPLGRMVANEIQTVLRLQSLMEESIVGQSHALEEIAQRIRTSRANLSDPRTPIGVFLLCGTSGVGKTETAITLANLLYGGEQNMTVINMSEFKEEHKVSLLMGSPPGYVGYGEGGVLTEAVRRKPYSVVLLDEMEKAHPGVQDVFYQVFDKGTMKDGEGRDIDFKNTVIMMTTNAGTDFIKSLCSDPDTCPDPTDFAEAIFPELLKTFKPAFLGRLSIVPYYPLGEDVMRKIIELKLGKVRRRIADNYRATFNYSDDLVNAILARCQEVDTGARNVDHILTRTVLPEMSAAFLARMAEGLPIHSVEISVNADSTFAYNVN
jgi:type VI secretion system protein VasG